MIEIKNPTEEDILKIITQPEMYDRMSNDYDPPLFEFVFKKFGDWIGGYVNGEIASLYWVHDFNQMHFMVDKGYREYARDLFYHSQNAWGLPVFCVIPDLYKTTINFAKKAGFTIIKKNKNSFKKNGKIYNEIIMELKHGRYR